MGSLQLIEDGKNRSASQALLIRKLGIHVAIVN